MIAACLVPVTRPELVTRAVSSVPPEIALLVCDDTARNGAAVTRNRLVEVAAARGCRWARFLDDDDELLDQRPMLDVLGTTQADIIYHDFETIDGKGRPDVHRFTGNPEHDLYAVGQTPWTFFARLNLLARVPFRPDRRALLGSWWWHDALAVGARCEHVAAVGYRYFLDTDANQITKSAAFRPERRLWKEKQQLYRDRQELTAVAGAAPGAALPATHFPDKF